MSDQIENYPGTSLSEQDIRQGKVLSVQDKMQADFAWDTGQAISSYLAGFKGWSNPGCILQPLPENGSTAQDSLRVVLSPHGPVPASLGHRHGKYLFTVLRNLGCAAYQGTRDSCRDRDRRRLTAAWDYA